MTEPELLKSKTGTRLHITGCPHTDKSALIPAAESEISELEVCSWCAAEIAGHGRTYFDTLEDALDELGAPKESKPKLAGLLREAEFDRIYVPNSRSYVSVTRGDQTVAYAGKTYVTYVDDRGTVELPGYVATSGSGGTASVETQWGEPCPRCFMARSMNGTCGCG